MVVNVLAQMVQRLSVAGGARKAASLLSYNSRSFRYRQVEVIVYWKRAAERSFGRDSSMMMSFKTLRWIPADSAMEAQRSYRVVPGKTGTYAAARTSWDYTLL